MVEASDEPIAVAAADRLTAALESALGAARDRCTGPSVAIRRSGRNATDGGGVGAVSVTECVLAIDLGTSGPKVALVAESGAVVDSEYEPTRLILTDDGGVEQDPDDWWRAITTATRRMMDRRRRRRRPA